MRNPFERSPSRPAQQFGPTRRVGREGQPPTVASVPRQRTPEAQDSPTTQELRPATFEPKVVDQPVVPFEPRPPSAPGYRPDTVIDGWSSALLDVRFASVRGYSHRYSGQPRQDHGALVHHDRTESLVFAVADGVGNAPLSEVGAELACETTIDFVAGALSSTGSVDGGDWRGLADAVAHRLEAVSLRGEGARLGGRRRSAGDFATTLVAGYVAPTADGLVATLIQIGDSGAWLLHGEQFHDLLTPKSRPGEEVVDSTVSALPDVPVELRPRRVLLPPDSVLLVGTDGFGRSSR